ncbi:RibD family protein [Deltaproteobacteria bacterium TL4]
MSKINVTLKIASTLDGKIATQTGHSRWITGETARLRAHELRSQHEAILVGINTVLADNPRLTTRNIEGGRSPIRIILDSHGRIPLESHCLQQDGIPVILATGCQVEAKTIKALQDAKIQVISAPTPRPTIEWLLSQLKSYSITSLLVEGGSQIHASFIQAQRVDRLVLFMAPKIIGGTQSLSWCGELGCFQVDQAPQVSIDAITPLGDDIMICAHFDKGAHEQ